MHYVSDDFHVLLRMCKLLQWELKNCNRFGYYLVKVLAHLLNKSWPMTSHQPITNDLITLFRIVYKSSAVKTKEKLRLQLSYIAS